MPVWLLEHRDPVAAQNANEVFERIAVRADTWQEARDLAARFSPMPARERKSDLDIPENVWTDREKTDHRDITADVTGEIIAAESFGNTGRPRKKSPAG